MKSQRTLSDSHWSNAPQSSAFSRLLAAQYGLEAIWLIKTPQGRRVLTKVTCTSSTFQANHNLVFHLRGSFSNFVFWTARCEPSLKPPLWRMFVSVLCHWSQTVRERLQTLRWWTWRKTVYAETRSCQRRAADIIWVHSRWANTGIGFDYYSGQKCTIYFDVWNN